MGVTSSSDSTDTSAASSASAWVIASSATMRPSTTSRRSVASAGLLIGLLPSGDWMIPASSAASVSESSPTGLEK